MPSQALMNISERKFGGCTFHPKVAVRIGNLQDGMVHETGIDDISWLAPSGCAYLNITGFNSGLPQHALHQIGQSLAVTELIPVHFSGAHGFLASDSYLNTYITVVLLHVTVEGKNLVPLVYDRVSDGMDCCCEFGWNFGTLFYEVPFPSSVFVNGSQGAFPLEPGEPVGRETDHWKQIFRQWHEDSVRN